MFDLVALVKAFGYLGLFGVIFAESGIFLGFFLPGDSVIFTAGFLASQGYLNIYFLCVLLFVAAVLGDNFGYWFGKKIGPMIFSREDSWFFHKNNVRQAHDFFTKHGGQSLILARFIPAVRTFTPIVAGVGQMNYRRFFFFNIIGGFLWAIGLTLAGYFFGRLVPDVDKYIIPIILLIIVSSLLPALFRFIKIRKK